MKQFFKFMFASMVGFLLCIVVVAFLFVGMVAALISSIDNKAPVVVDSNSILEINLRQPITERTPNNPLQLIDFSTMKSNYQPGLSDIIKAIKKAETDTKIKGIYLHTSYITGGKASIEEIRNALISFKKSKKFVIAYSEYYAQDAYYLASVADQIFLNAHGDLELTGYAANLTFLKGALDKLGVEAQVIGHGKFKSAIEPFVEERMSDANRMQVKTYVDDLWHTTRNGIASARKLDTTMVETIADSMLIETPEDAIKYGLVDKLLYEDEVINELKKRSGNIGVKPTLININKYAQPIINFAEKNKIAVIYANGDINSGRGNDESIGSETTAADIRKAADDNAVKAIVLRVNSPGGSALASEVIWRELSLAKAKKPIVVSMGDVAASGGYYISCLANKIVAQPNTITGSIGVFGLLFNAQKMFNEKLGITFDSYKTGNYSDMGNVSRPLTPAERMKLQNSVERIYGTFTNRVAMGRNIPQNLVDSIGQGRVWSGKTAKAIGLVDTLGGLDEALKIAASLAKISSYRTYELPIQKEPLSEILEDFNGGVKAALLKNEFGDEVKTYQQLKKLIKQQDIYMRMPFELQLN